MRRDNFLKGNIKGKLWVKEGKTGQYLAGTLDDGTPITVIQNLGKKLEKEPDYLIMNYDDPAAIKIRKTLDLKKNDLASSDVLTEVDSEDYFA